MTDSATQYEEFEDPIDGTRWSVDVEFLSSNWRCIWGAGCEGILDRPAAELGQGCCSVGAELLDSDESKLVAALAATIDEERFQMIETARSTGVFRDSDRDHTALVDGACIFLNRPGFIGGEGCALHLQAEADGERAIDWKPSVCWQLPLKVERVGSSAILRRWRRSDWGPGGETMAWCCTEADEPLIGSVLVAESLGEELEALVGPEVAVAIRERAVSR